jgi:hypothetical protein
MTSSLSQTSKRRRHSRRTSNLCDLAVMATCQGRRTIYAVAATRRVRAIGRSRKLRRVPRTGRSLLERENSTQGAARVIKEASSRRDVKSLEDPQGAEYRRSGRALARPL